MRRERQVAHYHGATSVRAMTSQGAERGGCAVGTLEESPVLFQHDENRGYE